MSSSSETEATNQVTNGDQKLKNGKQAKKKKNNFSKKRTKRNSDKNSKNNITISAKKNSNNNNKKKKKQKHYTSRKSKKSLSSSSSLDSKDSNIFGRELAPLTDLKLGSEIEGYVAAFTDFGVFIKTDYDFKNKKTNGYGLLHKSQIRDEPVEDLKKIFRIGARVKGLRVININYARGEVGLSLRKQRTQRKNFMEIPVGKDIPGTVAKVVSYGAFVDVGADVNALVHISRISQKKIRNIQHVIREGEKVTIHILNKDEEKKTMAASMLDRDADVYLDKRSKQMEKMRKDIQFDDLKSELEYFEDAVRELEEALGQ